MNANCAKRPERSALGEAQSWTRGPRSTREGATTTASVTGWARRQTAASHSVQPIMAHPKLEYSSIRPRSSRSELTPLNSVGLHESRISTLPFGTVQR